MFRKILALTLCALMLVTAAMAEGWTAPAAGDPMSLEGDIGLYLNDTFFYIGNDFKELEAVLGEADDVIATPSCAFKGEDKEYVYPDMSIMTFPLGDLDVWAEAYIEGGDYITSRGIGIGATQDEVIAAYGDAYYMEGDVMFYSLSGDPADTASPYISFGLTDGVVDCIDIAYPTNTL